MEQTPHHYQMHIVVSIPQAVGTVATRDSYGEFNQLTNTVSIPQAVGTVATFSLGHKPGEVASFNTASGRYCCNR